MLKHSGNIKFHVLCLFDYMHIILTSLQKLVVTVVGADHREGCRGCEPHPPPPCDGLGHSHKTLQSYQICYIVCFVFSVVHIMLLLSHKPSSLLFTFKICLHHPSVASSGSLINNNGNIVDSVG